MFARVAQAAVGLLLGVLAFSVVASAADAAGDRTVILLSLDGLRHDLPDRAETPALDRMQREGARAIRLTPVFPSNTFPNHVSLATGTHPDRHGIVGNSFIDAERGRFRYSNDASWIKAEPLWIAAERQGITSAVFFWVGSETDWQGRRARYRMAPFDSGVPESAKVDQILEWLDLPEAERPRLILSWWHGADHVQHSRGPAHASVARAVHEQDAQLGRLLSGLDARDAWSHTTLIVVSDHGMAELTRSVDVIAVLDEQGIPARIVPGGGMAFLWLEDPAQRDTAVALLRAIDGVRAWPSDAMPEGLRSYFAGRSGHVTVLVDPPDVLYRRSTWRRMLATLEGWAGAHRGGHGYRPDHEDMGGVFYALGRGVPAGLAPASVHAIDVAPTVSHLLGIDPPRHAEGRPIPGIEAAP